MNEEYKYPGEELALFQHAKRWKKYFSRQIKQYIKGKVLEAGAGIGNNTKLLNDGSYETWLLLEPDTEMAIGLQKSIGNNEYPVNCRLQKGTIYDVTEKFDTIIYIDVLEHIEADKEELKKAASLLNEGGRIIVVSPAFNHLYITFDKAIGHFRRYTQKTLSQISPSGAAIIKCRYLDSMGYFGLLSNKILMRHTMPSKKKIIIWDRLLVPVSCVTDKLFFHSFGKCIISIWEKKERGFDYFITSS